MSRSGPSISIRPACSSSSAEVSCSMISVRLAVCQSLSIRRSTDRASDEIRLSNFSMKAAKLSEDRPVWLAIARMSARLFFIRWFSSPTT